MHYQRYRAIKVSLCDTRLSESERACSNLDRVNCEVCLGIVASEHETRALALRERIEAISRKRIADKEEAKDAEAALKLAHERSKVALKDLVRKTFLN